MGEGKKEGSEEEGKEGGREGQRKGRKKGIESLRWCRRKERCFVHTIRASLDLKTKYWIPKT